MNETSKPTNYGALSTLVTVFFFWGFVAASNGIFIPFCKSHFNLDQFQSQLIDSSFYGAYFFGSLILYMFSSFRNVDILNQIGYKNGIIYGLLISVAGALALAFISGFSGATFGMVLISFFLIALGFSLQQTAAQPFAISLGDPKTGSHRLNFAGGVNSFGTLLGPLIVSVVLFGSLATMDKEATLGNIKTLYLILAGLFTAVAIFFSFRKLPAVTSHEKVEKSPKALISLCIIAIPTFILIFMNKWVYETFGETGKTFLIFGTLAITVLVLLNALVSSRKNATGWGAMQYPQLVLGMLGIFVYVGVEVTIQSNMGALLQEPAFGGYDVSHISQFISLYWGSLMIGRWTGAISAFDLKKSTKQILTILIPIIAFAVILLVNIVRGNAVNDLLIYIVCIAVLIAAIFLGMEKPARTLFIFSCMGILAMLIGLFTTGEVAKFAFISGGLCCSIGWPCIFALSIMGTGKYTSQGSAFLIMMILGGAIIPPLQGWFADKFDIHSSYWIAVICFIYLAWFALKVQNILKAQGIHIDAPPAAAH
ncbi:MAG: MFS transporter [Chitinophagales bacterium]|nr:MFS transporter [Chitinophagales bacterium]